MGIKEKMHFARNKTKILHYADSYIDRFSREYTGFISSQKKDILKTISIAIDSNYDSLSTVNEDDEWFIQEAVAYISHAAYDLLFDSVNDMGGNYVNPFVKKSLWGMHERAMKWALDRGLITQADIDEDREAYREDRRDRSHGML